MKKILAVILFIVSCIAVKINDVDAYVSTEFKIDWYSINIDIPLNGNFEEYKNNFIVKVYVDGIQLTSDKYYILLNQNGTSTSTVNTSKVGTYKIGARVELYGYNASSENYITYKVIDDTPPEITSTSDSITTRYGEVPDYESFVNLSDNSGADVSLIVKDTHINYNQIGEYDIELIAKDESGETSSLFITLYIVDIAKPVIKQLKPVEVTIGTSLDLSKYFEVIDHYDGNITEFMKVENLVTSSLGDQLVYVSVMDMSGNEARMLIRVTIIDDIPPTITFNSQDVVFSVDETITYDKLKQYIFSVDDNHSNISIDKVEIDFSKVQRNVGTYSVYYSVEDSSYNKCVVELIVRLVDMQGPTIICEDIELQLGETFDFDLLINYISVFDMYDTNVRESIYIDYSNVNLEVPGEYQIYVSAINKSGIKTETSLNFIIQGETTTSILPSFSSGATTVVSIVVVIIVLHVIAAALIIIKVKREKDNMYE